MTPREELREHKEYLRGLEDALAHCPGAYTDEHKELEKWASNARSHCRYLVGQVDKATPAWDAISNSVGKS